MEIKLSIIIPVFNEAVGVLNFYEQLRKRLHQPNTTEIIFVDGGSKDGTIQLLKKTSCRLVLSPKGRAKQMNHGAAVAQGFTLYFIHADSLPPYGFDQLILNAKSNGAVAGCFRMKFDSSHPMLCFFSYFTRFNLPLCRGGDQSLFISKNLFNELKGYNPDFEVYEDNEFTGRIYKTTPFTILKPNLVTSSRKYVQKGVWKLQFHFGIMHLLYFTTRNHKILKRYYQTNIS